MGNPTARIYSIIYLGVGISHLSMRDIFFIKLNFEVSNIVLEQLRQPQKHLDLQYV